MPAELTLDTLKAELAGLELRIVDRIKNELDKKADRSHVEALEKDLEIIKVQGSPAVIGVQQNVAKNAERITAIEKEQLARAHYIPQIKALQQDVDILKTWRTRLALVTALLVIAVPPVTAVVINYF